MNIVTDFSGGWYTLKSKYVHSLAIDDPLSVEQGTNIYYYHKDGLGNVTELTDSAGNVVKTYNYRGFGEIHTQTGTVIQPFAFTSREYDLESGLYFYRGRYYDPRAGRFINRDPIGFAGGDVNLFRYVQNNPVNFVDPYGLRIEWNDYILNNTLVIRNLIRLNQTIVDSGIRDDQFVLSVTGGDRFRDSCGQIRSVTTYEIIPGASSTSPHLIERGARAVDLNVLSVSNAVFDAALLKTDFLPANTQRNYPDGHTHTGLPNTPKYSYPHYGNP